MKCPVDKQNKLSRFYVPRHHAEAFQKELRNIKRLKDIFGGPAGMVDFLMNLGVTRSLFPSVRGNKRKRKKQLKRMMQMEMAAAIGRYVERDRA